MTLLKAGRPSNTVAAIKMMEDEKDPLFKLSLNLPKSLHKKAKGYAFEHDITLTQLVCTSLQEYIKK